MTTEVATLIAALTGLITAVGTLIGVILTHGKVGSVASNVESVGETVDAVKKDTQIIKNGKGGDTHDGAPSV